METKDILNEFLKSLLEGLKEAGALVKDQMPLVLQEYVTWGIVHGFIWFGVWAIIAALLIWFAIWMGKKVDVDDFGPVVFVGVVALVSLSTSLIYLSGAIKALVAPRVYLIDELSKLL